MTLNRQDPDQLSMLIIILMGCFFCLRGNTEHSDLEISNIESGFYPSNSPFAGFEFIGVTNLLDKSHKLT